MRNTVAISADRLEFKAYPFESASVQSVPFVFPDQVALIRPECRPLEIHLKDGEILFVDESFRPELMIFAKFHRIALVDGIDIWSEFAENYLKDPPTREMKKSTRERLIDAGFPWWRRAWIRDRIGPQMKRYNAVLGEWLHLGHYDILASYKTRRGIPFSPESNRNFYRWTMKIAARNSNHWKALKDPSGDEQEWRTAMEWKLDACLPMEEKLRAELSEILWFAYREPHRSAHGLKHALSVVDGVRSLCLRLGITDEEERRPLILAAWFHDIIYDPKSVENEKQSARVLRDFFPDGGDDIDKAAEMIELSADHFKASTVAEKILSDADLLVLGSDPKTYEAYARGVRSEFAHVEETAYRVAREAFLRGLLDRPKIYHFLEPICERLLRKNVAWEIATLLQR